MMKTTTVICDFCGIKVEKPAKEIARQRRKGRTKFYCSLSHSKKEHGATHLLEWANSDENKENLSKNKCVWKDELTPFREYIRRAKIRNRENGREVDLSLEYLKELWEYQNGCCVYTKVELQHPNSKGSSKEYTHNYVASLDRIDSNKGYIEGNVQFISISCNYLKNKFDNEHMMEFFKIVVEAYGG